MEESSVDILKQIAKREGWEFNVREKTVRARYGYTIRDVLIKNYNVKNSFFVSEQASKYGKYAVYSGVFFPVNYKYDFHLLIRERNIFDKLSFRKNKFRFKTGNTSFDSKLFVTTNNDTEAHKLLSNAKIQNKIIEFIYSKERLQIAINELNPDFTDELKGEKYLGLFTFLDWMTDKQLIEKAYSLGQELMNKLNHKY